MPAYLLFGWHAYEAAGGPNDYRGSYPTLGAAHRAAQVDGGDTFEVCTFDGRQFTRLQVGIRPAGRRQLEWSDLPESDMIPLNRPAPEGQG